MPSKKWERMRPIYRHFAESVCDGLDYSESAAVEMYEHESTGTPVDKNNNGYYVGKRWLNVQVEMWKEDIGKGLFFPEELYGDPKYDDFHWWLDSVFDASSA